MTLSLFGLALGKATKQLSNDATTQPPATSRTSATIHQAFISFHYYSSLLIQLLLSYHCSNVEFYCPLSYNVLIATMKYALALATGLLGLVDAGVHKMK